MYTWQPISASELQNEMQKTEADLEGKVGNFWQLIKIEPEKWSEPTFGKEGGGFWVVGLCGRKVIWYNDIEDGFNISDYKTYGEIDGYYCNSDELSWAVRRLFKVIQSGAELSGQLGGPEPLSLD